MNLTRKIIAEHLLSGQMEPGTEIGLKIDQTLTQDATGTMAYLQFEALGVPKVNTELSVSYVDHNTLQTGFRNADDHRFLRSVAAKYGLIFSPPGTGICHQLHLENFARPGRTLIGSDSHTPTAGGLACLAMGAGGLSVALAMAGEPYMLPMPEVMLVYLEGRLSGFATAKDIILHLLSVLSVKGGVGKVLEYGGPGAASLSVPERATITNMGAELGATASIFPSDEQTRRFLDFMGRSRDFAPLAADENSAYEHELKVDLSALVPLVARPHMPDLVTPVSELDGLAVQQVVIGSCTNSSYADLKIVSEILKGRRVNPETDLLIAPGSKQVLKMLIEDGSLEILLDSGARLLECACGPCIGIGGSPPSGGISVRTINRNFEGRSGTKDAGVYLASPVTAVMAAIEGRFTDPKKWGSMPAMPVMPEKAPSISALFLPPAEDPSRVEVLRGPNIAPLPIFDGLGSKMDTTVMLKVSDNITTDHIMPAGTEIMALRSNIPAISEYVFKQIDAGFAARMKKAGHGIVVAGENYGQGSSREHAALAPRFLGVRAVLAKSLARIHRANLINVGILPLLFADKGDYERLPEGAKVSIPLDALTSGGEILMDVEGDGGIKVINDLSEQELAVVRAGGLLNQVRLRRRIV